MRDEGSATGRERFVGDPKFHHLGISAPKNIHSDWVSSAFSGLCIKVNYGHHLCCILKCNIYKTF